MAKKNFKNNPALQFISIPEEESALEEFLKSKDSTAEISTNFQPLLDTTSQKSSQIKEKKESPKEKKDLQISHESKAEQQETKTHDSIEEYIIKKEESDSYLSRNENNPFLPGYDYQDINNPALAEALTNRSGLLKPNPYPLKPNPAYIETKSKRVQLLIQPTLYNQIKKIAENRGRSVNDLIHCVLENFVKTNQNIVNN